MAHTMLKTLVLLVTFIPLLLVSSVSIRNGNGVNPFEGYTIVPLNFKGTIHGVEVELNGTIQEIHAQFSEMYPDVVANATAPPTVIARDGGFDIGARAAADKAQILCCPVAGQSWDYCDRQTIMDGISYLQGVTGCCGVGAGAGTCVRVGCYYNAAIYLCNDNIFPLCTDCGYIASYAYDLIGHCSQFLYDIVCGQEFDTNGYNVIVTSDRC